LEKSIPAINEIDEYKSLLGKKQKFSELLQFFEKKLAKQSRKDLIYEIYSKHHSGIINSAFHPFIQLGFGLIPK
jgi:hypothetical protein